jgi:hypothetical protein
MNRQMYLHAEGNGRVPHGMINVKMRARTLYVGLLVADTPVSKRTARLPEDFEYRECIICNLILKTKSWEHCQM